MAIRRLYEDFDADYIVLDTRNGGIAILDMLSKVMYDDERKIEYAPLKCMNNDNFADRIKNSNALPVIYAVNATQQLNSDIAFSFRQALTEKKVELLIGFNDALDEILTNMNEYNNARTGKEQAFYEAPFLETQMLISETSDLVYEKMPQTGVIKIHEQGNNRKDRYTSVSYANYFADLLEQDLLSDNQEYDFCCLYN